MTAGDPISVFQPIPANEYLEIRPPLGEVWMLKNLYFGGEWELYRLPKEADTSILIGSGVDSGMWKNMTIIVNSEIFLVIKNVSEISSSFGFDGLVIK